MLTQLFLTLALAAGTALAAPSQLQVRKLMVRDQLNATIYNDYMDCVKNASTSTKYEVAIDHGAVVIVPPQGATINLHGADKALAGCLHEFSPYIRTAVDAHRLDLAVSTSLSNATAQWAESHGAEGVSLQASTVALRSDLFPRTLGYYYSYPSFDQDCSSYDQKTNQIGDCPSNFGAYKCVRFENPDTTTTMTVTYWPHHDCANRHNGQDGRTINLAAGATSGNLADLRAIYSWRASYP